jgi:hypothetical protein
MESLDCATQGGAYEDDGVPCDPDPCGPPIGACCFDGGATCVHASFAGCVNLAGVYQGDGTLCAGGCAAAGACCFSSGTCESFTAAVCAALGGAFQGSGVSCNPSPCPPPCPEDIDSSGDVGFGDLLMVLSDWGPCAGCATDLTGDGSTGFQDLLLVLAEWGPC